MSETDFEKSDAAFDKLRAEVFATPRGAWFLDEFARRLRGEDVQEILDRVDRALQAQPNEESRVNILRKELQEMASSIMKARAEIAAIRPDGGDNDRIGAATEELDAIVTSTEEATENILRATETIQEELEQLRGSESGPADAYERIESQAVEIFTACSFQDLTGQRISKVVALLRHLESRINAVMQIWDADGTSGAPIPADERPDAHLLNGPQLPQHATSQDDIDQMMASDSNATEASQSGGLATDKSPPEENTADAGDDTLNEDDIDALFDQAGAA
ncbi:MAG: hypothetical protein Tsb0010_15970 [Parvularculaceae bacterium]